MGWKNLVTQNIENSDKLYCGGELGMRDYASWWMILGCVGILHNSDLVDFPGCQAVKSVCNEDSLEKDMATHSNILAWEIPWQRSLAGYSPWGGKKVRHDWATNTFIEHPLFALGLAKETEILDSKVACNAIRDKDSTWESARVVQDEYWTIQIMLLLSC